MYKIENDMETEPERWTEATKQMKVKEHRCILYLLNDPSLHAPSRPRHRPESRAAFF